MSNKSLESNAIDSAEPDAARVDLKWGESAIAGWQPVPDLLFKHQADLELTATDVVVLLNILLHWWYAERMPYPRLTTVARRMGATTRTVQRSLTRLKQAGVIISSLREDGSKQYDPTPLVRKLEGFAMDDPIYQFRKEERNSA